MEVVPTATKLEVPNSFKKKFTPGDVKCIGLPGQCNVATFEQVAITATTTIDLKTTSVTRFVNGLSTKKYVNVETAQSTQIFCFRAALDTGHVLCLFCGVARRFWVACGRVALFYGLRP